MKHADTDPKLQLMQAALAHVPFDGWSPACFEAAIVDCGMDAGLAQAICPRGAVDLAVAFHQAGDAQMEALLAKADLGEMRFRDRIAHAVRVRLELCEDKEVVRRGTSLFALPHHAATGAQLIWGTCDAIWTALGDSSDDFNWYSKRATLSAVYGSTVLFWLGDESVEAEATWHFLDRRIENVMQFEKLKSQVSSGPIGKLLAGPLAVLERVKAPKPAQDVPGRWR